jgi:hypothetical protein
VHGYVWLIACIHKTKQVHAGLQAPLVHGAWWLAGWLIDRSICDSGFFSLLMPAGRLILILRS